MTDDRSLTHLLTTTSKTVFTTQDFDKIWRYRNYRSLIQRISYLQKKAKIKKIRRGLYSITGREINEFELANKLRTPSYLSFETVLFKSGAIFQWDQRLTLAGPESIRLKVAGREIVFRQLKDKILLNPMGIDQENHASIATLERAVLDTLYLNPRAHFDNISGVDFDRLDQLAEIYQTKRIKQLAEKLKHHA